MLALEPAHVLDDAEHRYVYPLEHLRAAKRVARRDVLRGRHDYRARDPRRLDERQLRVAGSRRHVYDQEVELSPVHVTEELGDDLHDDRSAPDRGLVALYEEADADELDTVRLERDDLRVGRALRQSLPSHQPRDVRAVDVWVHQPDARSLPRERDREIGRDSGLAHATLAARHGDDGPEVGVSHRGRRGYCRLL